MAEIEPGDPKLRSMTGLHLYHAGRSACSARVRFALEEKGLAWTGHYVDIYKRENVSAAYFAINPKGLVPTLVHDGRVIVESNDILLYLEDAFPEPSFVPAGARAEIESWLQRCGDMHLPGVKTFAYARTHAANVVKTPEEIALYRSLQKDRELLEFHARHDGAGKEIAEEEVARATGLLRDTLAEIDAIVGRETWLVGGEYSLAEISWAPAITTLQGAGFDFSDFPELNAWYDRIAARPAFETAVAAWRRDPAPA